MFVNSFFTFFHKNKTKTEVPHFFATGWFYVCGILFIFAGRPGGRPLQEILIFLCRGDSRIARFFIHDMRSFSAGDEPPPYKRNLTSSKVLSYNTVLFLKNQFYFTTKTAHSA